MDELDMTSESFLKELYNQQVISTFEAAIKYKFPEIKSLEVTRKEDGNLSIKFEDDGVHTYDMVNDWLNELVKQVSN